MRGRLGIVIALATVFSFVVLPTHSALARTLTFAEGPVLWKVTVKVCQNGFAVTASGGTVAGVTTAVKVVDAQLLLPNDKPPFIRMTRPLPFTAARGSALVASVGDPQFQVTGTATFFFNESLSPGTLVQITVEGYGNDAPLNIPDGAGVDTVNNCTLPPLPPLATNLSGVNPVDLAMRGNSFGNDGRSSPSAADHMAVYCLTVGEFAGTIVVNGLDKNGNGYRLEDFKLNDFPFLYPKAISKPALNNQGELILFRNAQNVFGVVWTHGPWSPYEAKGFSCFINKSMYNKTGSQLAYPDAFGNDGRVAPNMTDKVAVYCRIDKRVIDIVGIDRKSQGYGLALFKYADVVAASPNPMIKNIPNQGSVALRVDYDDNFLLEWKNGPWVVDQTKSFKCRF